MTVVPGVCGVYVLKAEGAEREKGVEEGDDGDARGLAV